MNKYVLETSTCLIIHNLYTNNQMSESLSGKCRHFFSVCLLLNFMQTVKISSLKCIIPTPKKVICSRSFDHLKCEPVPYQFTWSAKSEPNLFSSVIQITELNFSDQFTNALLNYQLICVYFTRFSVKKQTAKQLSSSNYF